MAESYERVRDAVRVLARINRVLEAADSGLTVPQYRMLSALSEGGQRSARLAERLAIRKPTATAIADGLVAAGYAQREGEPGDRRIVRLTITPAGAVALERADQTYVSRLGYLITGVPDPEHFINALLTIGAEMDARAAAGDGPSPGDGTAAPPVRTAESATAPAQPMEARR